MIKCKECNASISSKAQACPSCGMKTPKKIGVIGWLFMFFIFIPTVAILALPDSDNQTTEKPYRTLEPAPKTAPTPPPTWTTFTSHDEMTGKPQHFAVSPESFASPQMDSPYRRVNASLAFGCDGTAEWPYLYFSQRPNLANTETESGYYRIKTRIKWGDEISNETLTQEWQSKFMHFGDKKLTITRILTHKTAKLELQWHGQKPAYFDLDLSGSKEAIKAARELCLKSKPN